MKITKKKQIHNQIRNHLYYQLNDHLYYQLSNQLSDELYYIKYQLYNHLKSIDSEDHINDN